MRRRHKILYENQQWSVTSYGVEANRPWPEYFFSADRLTERDWDDMYGWPRHMAEKTWVDVDMFCDAFSRALDIHIGKYSEPKCPDRLAKSIEEAKRERAEDVEHAAWARQWYAEHYPLPEGHIRIIDWKTMGEEHNAWEAHKAALVESKSFAGWGVVQRGDAGARSRFWRTLTEQFPHAKRWLVGVGR